MNRRSFLLALVPALWAAAPALADVGPDRVLVVVNDSSAISVAVGSYYAAVRHVPAPNVFHLPAGTTTSENIDRSTYNAQIRDPIIHYLTVEHPELATIIKFILLTKDVPLHVWPDASYIHTSVDSELTLLFTGLVPDSGEGARKTNPYFGRLESFDEFTHPSISFLVFRLDGYQTNPDPHSGVPADIQRLIDDAQSPAAWGTFVLDAQSVSGPGDDWMRTAAADLTAMGVPVIYDTDPGTFLHNQADVLGYCSWGSNDPSNPGAPFYGEVPPGSGLFYPGLLLPGAITTDYVSTSGRTFIDGNQNYGQSLTADLVHIGAAGGNGHVWEPLLDAVARPQIVFRDYLEGFSAGEAYYHGIQYLHWMNVVVLDPLMKSGLHAGLPPRITSVTPSGSHVGGDPITIMGKDFTNPAWSTVTFGGVPSPSVDTVSRTQMTAVAPALDPGIYDVTVATPFGTSVKPQSYLALPAITLDGTPAPGQTLSLTLWDVPFDQYDLFLSLGTASIDVPPFGRLLLDPAASFALVAQGGFYFGDYWVVVGTIPDDPALSGLSLYLQALMGPAIGDGRASFSNRIDLTIQ